MGYINDKLRWVACGGPFQLVSQTYLCGLDPSRGRDTHTELDYKRPKRGAVATQVQRVSYAWYTRNISTLGAPCSCLPSSDSASSTAFFGSPGDIVLLDLNLPKMDGMQVAAEMRKISPTVPIIMLTARDSESDQVLGLEMGTLPDLK